MDHIARLVDQLILFLPRLGGSLLIFGLFWTGAVILKSIIDRIGRRSRLHQQDVIGLLAQITKFGIIIFGAVVALGTIGVNVSAAVAGLGLVGFALGFALKDAVSNVLAGAMILFFQPFVRGDMISVTGLEGEVVQIDFRYTVLRAEGKRILLPNASLLTNAIIISHRSTPAAKPQ